MLLQFGFFLTQLLKKNGEYVELHDAFKLLLQEHNQHSMFHLLNSCTFFKECLTLFSAGTFQVSVGDTPVFLMPKLGKGQRVDEQAQAADEMEAKVVAIHFHGLS